jgi:hypothetical protein
MEHTQDTWIDVEGTLKNLNNYGFTTLDCIGEELDNAISANATTIEFTVNAITREIIFADDGTGMTKDGLETSNVFNKRSVSANTKHGRFGAGAKYYNSKMSDVSGVVLQVSKTIDNPKIHQISFDYDEFIKRNNITLYAHQVTTDTQKLWERCAIAPDKSGTLKHIVGTPTILNELRGMIEETKDISNSLSYRIGCSYCKEIVDKKIDIRIKFISEKGEHVRQVVPIDPLCWNQIDAKHKLETHIQVYKNAKTNTTIGMFNDGNRKVYRAINTTTKRYNTNDFENSLDFKYIGDVMCQSTYSDSWENIQRKDIEKTGCVVGAGAGIQSFRKNAGGKYIERNNKKIARFDVLQPTSGDTWRYKYFEDVRHNIMFSASSEMDEIFGVGVNKNDIREENINKQIWEDAVKFVCDLLSKKLCKMYEPKAPKPKTPEPTKTPDPPKTPEVKAPEVKTPEVKAPEVKTPEVKAPEVKTPEPPKTPAVKAPEVKAPEVKAPEVKTPDPHKMPDIEKKTKLQMWSDACKIIMDKIASDNFDKTMEECQRFMKFANEL